MRNNQTEGGHRPIDWLRNSCEALIAHWQTMGHADFNPGLGDRPQDVAEQCAADLRFILLLENKLATRSIDQSTGWWAIVRDGVIISVEEMNMDDRRQVDRLSRQCSLLTGPGDDLQFIIAPKTQPPEVGKPYVKA
jgi:hypothetical protein